MASAQLHTPSPSLPDPPLCREAGHCRIKTGHMLIRVVLALRGRCNGGDRDLCRVWPNLHCSIGGCVFGVCVYKEISIAWFHKKYVCSSSNDVRTFFSISNVTQELKVDKEKRRKEREESSSRGTTAGRDFINKEALRWFTFRKTEMEH